MFRHPNEVYAEVVGSFEEFKRCNRKEMQLDQIAKVAPSTRQLIWQPPPNEAIKINWDGSINSKEGCIGLGIAWEVFWEHEV